MSSATMLPNPYTPMAFLPETLALKITIQTYAIVGSLGALVWDIIVHLPQDFKLATQHRINFPFIVYCVSRLSCLAYLLAIVIVSTAPIFDCSMVQKVSFIYSVATPSTLLLFVFRVCALYHSRKYAVVFFSSLWLALLACSIVMPFGVSAYTIPVSGYCIEVKSKLAYSMADISPFVHDTIIFLATSWAFVSNSYRGLTFENGVGVLLFGRFLPAFSRSVLRDGQLYYLSTLLLNVVVIIVYYLHLPWLSSCTFGIPLFVLMNAVAAHIYRNIRFKVYMDQTITSSALNRDLMGFGLAGSDPSGAGIPDSSSSKPKSNGRHVLDITFKKSTTSTIQTTGTGARHSIEADSSIQDEEVGGLDLEKQDV